MEVNKYQSGGPFMVYQPLPMQPPMGDVPIGGVGNTATAVETETIPQAIIKDMLGKGLTNDVMAFKQEVDKAYAYYNNMSDIEKNSPFGEYLKNVMKGDFAKLNQLQRAKEQYDLGVDRIKENDATSDYAITNQGVIIKDMETGRLGEVSHSDFASKYRKDNRYKMLTNAELLTERENNPNLVGDLQSLEVMKNAIGMSKVRDRVREVLTNLGKNSASTSSNYIFSGSTGSVVNGSKEFMNSAEAAVEQYFKQKQSSSKENNNAQLAAAAETMWINLDANAKSLLKARAIQQGATGNSIEALAKDMAISLLAPASASSESMETELDYESGMSADRRARTKAEKESLDGLGYWGQIAAGKGDGTGFKMTLGDSNDWGLELYGQEFGPMSEKGSVAGPSMVRDLNDLKANIIPNSVTIGDQQLTEAQVNSLRYEGGSLKLVEVPIRYAENGAIIPEAMERIREYGELQDALETNKKKNPNLTAEAKATIIRNKGFNPVKLPNGDVVPDVPTGQFLATEVTINERALPQGSNKYLREVSKQEKDSYLSDYQYGSNKAKNSKSEKIAGATDNDGRFWSPSTWFGDVDVYKGVVFMGYTPGRHISAANTDLDKPYVDKNDRTRDNLSGGYRSNVNNTNNISKYGLE